MARNLTGLRGIVNGTGNFILSQMAGDRVSFADALADVQRAGYAEPDPSKDVNGDDAVEKLSVSAAALRGFQHRSRRHSGARHLDSRT